MLMKKSLFYEIQQNRLIGAFTKFIQLRSLTTDLYEFFLFTKKIFDLSLIF